MKVAHPIETIGKVAHPIEAIGKVARRAGKERSHVMTGMSLLILVPVTADKVSEVGENRATTLVLG